MRIADVPDQSILSIGQRIRHMVTIFGDRGFDVVVFDLTTPDVAQAGFKVMRTVIPGMQPLDIHHNLQHLGGRRLFDVPRQLGFTAQPSNASDLNPYPHPFP